MKRLLLVCASACGSVSQTPTTNPDAAEPGSDAPPDGAPPTPMWSTPTLIPGVSMPNVGDAMPTLRDDLCEMYFASDRDGNQDIYVTTRFSTSDPWATPTRVAELSSTVTDSGPELSSDGKTIWIARNTSANGFEIVVATRNSPSDPWSTPVPVSELSSTNDDRAPQVTSDGRTLFWVRDTGVNATKELWTATWSAATSTWTNLRDLAKLNSEFDEENPTTIGDGSEMYFDTNRDDGTTYFVYHAVKPVGGTWETPTQVPELAGALGTEVSPDGHYMVMAKVGTDGRSDLYESFRP